MANVRRVQNQKGSGPMQYVVRCRRVVTAVLTVEAESRCAGRYVAFRSRVEGVAGGSRA